MEAIAKAKFLRGSPQKTRLVIDLIRGKNVNQALAVLKFTNKRATENIEKCLRSAIANATFKAEQQNVAVDPDDLWVKTCFVDQGPSKNRRRVRPAPQGRAYREKRYYCHITIEVSSEKPKAVAEKERKANEGKARREAILASRQTLAPKAAPAKKDEAVKAETEETVVTETVAPESVETASQETAAPVTETTTTETTETKE